MDPRLQRLHVLTIIFKELPYGDWFFERHEDGTASSILRTIPLHTFISVLAEYVPIVRLMHANLPAVFKDQSIHHFLITESMFEQLMVFVDMAYEHYKENPDDYAVHKATITQ